MNDNADINDLKDLVHSIAAEVAPNRTTSFNAFCIAQRLNWDRQSALRTLLDEASYESYYAGLERGSIQVADIAAADVRLSTALNNKFGWEAEVVTDLLRACSASGIVRGFCATVLDLRKERLIKE